MATELADSQQHVVAPGFLGDHLGAEERVVLARQEEDWLGYLVHPGDNVQLVYKLGQAAVVAALVRQFHDVTTQAAGAAQLLAESAFGFTHELIVLSNTLVANCDLP